MLHGDKQPLEGAKWGQRSNAYDNPSSTFFFLYKESAIVPFFRDESDHGKRGGAAP